LLSELGQRTCNQVVIFDELMESNSLFLTGNAGTVYVTRFLDLKLHGPIVVEIPAPIGVQVENTSADMNKARLCRNVR